MHNFSCDYSEGAHPKILELLFTSNLEQSPGYGEDHYSEEARRLIQNEIAPLKAQVYFVAGGTQANLITIAAILRPHEAVISADTGHINVHEAGAIEATGHKVLTAQSNDGKLTPALIKPLLVEHADHHMVKPRLVYISNPTEMGTVYTTAELDLLAHFCRQYDLLLFLDGARLGTALASPEQELQLVDVARYTDAFTIGGTKNGALFGEAIVLRNPLFQDDFLFHIKQRGGLLAKGRLLGLQFKALFTDNLYYENARHANQMAHYLKEGIKDRGYRLLVECHANLIFAIFPLKLAEYLVKQYKCSAWQKVGTEICLRIVTSWATEAAAVEQFLADLPPVGQVLNGNFAHNQTVAALYPANAPGGDTPASRSAKKVQKILSAARAKEAKE